MSPMDHHDLWTIAGIAAVVCLVAVVVILRRRKTPDEIERERRGLINARGRIAEGSLVQLIHRDGRRLLCFQYSVGQVTYNAAQDITSVTGPGQPKNIDEPCEGLPARVKYDPLNPSNSIVVCETWSGLG